MSEPAVPPGTPETWAVVELMGHVRLAGRLSEEERFGAKMGRLDVPNDDGGFTTVHFGGASVYKITACTEAVARVAAKGSRPQPVSPWDFPKSLPAAADECRSCPDCHQESCLCPVDDDEDEEVCPDCDLVESECVCGPKPPF
jgi:hypothetical protein